MDLKEHIRDIPDFPKEGIIFKDITPLLMNPEAFRSCIAQFVEAYKDKGITKIASSESRGFIFGAVLAHELQAGFVPLRKPGKLPYKTIRQEFETEYSTDAFEIHEDAIEKGDKVLIVDDVLATGGTARAAVYLVEHLGGKVEALAFLIELDFLKGKEKLNGYDIMSLIHY